MHQMEGFIVHHLCDVSCRVSGVAVYYQTRQVDYNDGNIIQTTEKDSLS